jgi:hypothetical protein
MRMRHAGKEGRHDPERADTEAPDSLKSQIQVVDIMDTDFGQFEQLPFAWQGQ